MTKEYQGYIITDTGEIFHNNRKLKPQPNSKGYLRINIHGKMYFVHRLTAMLFIPNPENKPQVNHIDGNKLNNSVNNLEWCTNAENRLHAVEHRLHNFGEKNGNAKLTKEAILYIRKHYVKRKRGCTKELADRFGVNPMQITKIARGDAWKQV